MAKLGTCIYFAADFVLAEFSMLCVPQLKILVA